MNTEDKVKQQMEDEIRRRLSYATKFGEEFDVEGATNDLMLLYKGHSTYYRNQGVYENMAAWKKRMIEVHDMMMKKFGFDVADLFAKLLIK